MEVGSPTIPVLVAEATRRAAVGLRPTNKCDRGSELINGAELRSPALISIEIHLS